MVIIIAQNAECIVECDYITLDTTGSGIFGYRSGESNIGRGPAILLGQYATRSRSREIMKEIAKTTTNRVTTLVDAANNNNITQMEATMPVFKMPTE